MFLRLAIAVTLLALTMIVETGVQSKWNNSNPSNSEPALILPQEVSESEKNKVLRAIKSHYGDKEADKIADLNFIKASPTWPASRGVVLRESKGKLYLLTSSCDTDWSEMEILIYSKPYEIKRGIENLNCEHRKVRLKLAEVKQNEP
jgi:hypothetical protein